MSLQALLSGDLVTATPYVGETAYGPSYGDPVIVDCRVGYERKLVRDASGDEVVSEMTVYALPVLNGRPAAEVFAPETLVEHLGRHSRVIGVAPHRGMGPTVLVEITTT